VNVKDPAFAKTPPRQFYGWLVVAGAFAVTFVGFGCVYSFSAFIDSASPAARYRCSRLRAFSISPWAW
jgi:hypothetical protein